MFYKTGVDITKDKQMFEFLKNHFEYPTMNSWNRTYSVANNVKIYNLGLTGDCWTALSLLESDDYDDLRFMLADWAFEHTGYHVYFNGRSCGYLVLTKRDSMQHVLPDFILDCDTYEDYKEYCKDYFGSVKANRSDLVYYTKLVQDFDRLCDELRDYCDKLSNMKFETVEMYKTVDRFNDEYADDLELLGFQSLSCDVDGRVDISEIGTFRSLVEAFYRIANRSNVGYKLEVDEDDIVKYISKY